MGFGGRTFRARDRDIFVEPLKSRTGVQMGFCLATLGDGVSDDTAGELADFLSSPARAAAEEMAEALQWIVSHYGNVDLNHVDFRVEALGRAQEALAKAGVVAG